MVQCQEGVSIYFETLLIYMVGLTTKESLPPGRSSCNSCISYTEDTECIEAYCVYMCVDQLVNLVMFAGERKRFLFDTILASIHLCK